LDQKVRTSAFEKLHLPLVNIPVVYMHYTGHFTVMQYDNIACGTLKVLSFKKGQATTIILS